MPVIRKEIRHAITALMGTIPDVTVYESRIYPLSILPAISVYTLDESIDEESFSMDDSSHRVVNIGIEINDKATTEIDDNLDDLAFLVEEKIKTDSDLGGLVQCLTYVGTNIELSGESDKAVGVAKLNYIALT